jgi:hypothetical protein
MLYATSMQLQDTGALIGSVKGNSITVILRTGMDWPARQLQANNQTCQQMQWVKA